MRDKDREREKKKEIRETKEIKIEIRPSQLQTVITFDRKLQLKCVMRPQKSYNDVGTVNFRTKNSHLQAQK
jgi:hypothetical protein